MITENEFRVPADEAVCELVFNLRESVLAARVAGSETVGLSAELVLEIASAIEQMGAFSLEADGLVKDASKAIMKAIVKRAFAPAIEETEKALEVCQGLDLTESQVKELLAVPPAVNPWLGGTLGLVAFSLLGDMIRAARRYPAPASPSPEGNP